MSREAPTFTDRLFRSRAGRVVLGGLAVLALGCIPKCGGQEERATPEQRTQYAADALAAVVLLRSALPENPDSADLATTKDYCSAISTTAGYLTNRNCHGAWRPGAPALPERGVADIAPLTATVSAWQQENTAWRRVGIVRKFVTNYDPEAQPIALLQIDPEGPQPPKLSIDQGSIGNQPWQQDAFSIAGYNLYPNTGQYQEDVYYSGTSARGSLTLLSDPLGKIAPSVPLYTYTFNAGGTNEKDRLMETCNPTSWGTGVVNLNTGAVTAIVIDNQRHLDQKGMPVLPTMQCYAAPTGEGGLTPLMPPTSDLNPDHL